MHSRGSRHGRYCLGLAAAAAPARHDRHGSFRNGSVAVHDVETDLVVLAARADAPCAPCHEDLERRGERDEAAEDGQPQRPKV